jgi:signal peptidase II
MRVPLLAALLVAADQLTKFLAVTRLKAQDTHSVTVIPGFFSLSYVENPGAAWGMLAGQQIFLIAFSLLTLGFLFWRRKQLFDGLWGGSVTLALITGGVVGNLIDRIRVQYVIDFLDFHWGASHFPAFNIADSCICCGVFLFIATQWHHDRKKEELGVRS